MRISRDSALADNIRENDLLFPLIESVHVVSICLVVGSILVVDLRFWGSPRSTVREPRHARNFAAHLVRVRRRCRLGQSDVISNATKYLENGYFVAKMLLIGAAGLNMVIFHAISARNQPQWENKARLPLPARLAGGLSILLWISVVACGRWIGFTMRIG